jgi:hypothetical protein
MLSYVVATVQNSARAQQTNSIVTCHAGHDAFRITTPSDSFHRHSSRLQILIANPRLELELSSNDLNQLQIPNRERMAICPFTRSSRPPLFRLSPATRPSSPVTVFLIVTPRLEFSATATKQNSNMIPNRYKTPFFDPLSCSSPIAVHSTILTRPRADKGPLLPRPPGKL